ncbi:MAG: FAD-binding oxidoreductase [Thalassobaculum sp.]|uniref:NAD(P)/FAD-dependent oxidoreductase n=1 Tax=Thalassobaculum sp. TaxID=2022740 RepID=UPI0032EB1FA2
MTTTTCDVLIVGGGMAGASCGYFLADDARVVLLEREEQPGYHTTGRSAALFYESYGNATIRRITRATRPFLETPPDGFAAGPILSPRGMLTIATEELVGRLDAQAAQEAGPRTEPVEGEALFALAPFLRRDRIVKGVYEPDAMDIDVNALLQGFLRGLRARGGSVVTDAEVSSLTRAGGVWRAETRAGRFEAPVVINAAGAWCDALADMAGVPPVGLVPKRRTAFTFDPPAGADVARWPGVDLVDESWYVIASGGRVLGSPADETPSEPCDAQPDEYDVAVAVDRIMTDTTFEIRRLASRWAGLRSFVADKSPVVGFDPSTDGFLWLAGQGGYGIQTSAGMGRLSAAMATGRGVPDDMTALGLTAADLAPDRPALTTGKQAK